MSVENQEHTAAEPHKLPALPGGRAQLPPPAPAQPGGRVPPLSSLISQGGPSKRGYGRSSSGAGAADSTRVPTVAVPLPQAQQTPRPNIPQAPSTNGESYSTIHEAIAASGGEGASVFNMPPLPMRESSAVPTPTHSLEQAKETGNFSQLFRETAGEDEPASADPIATSPPAPALPPGLPASMPAPPPPRRPAPSMAPLNAEEIPVSSIDPEELLKPSRRSHQSPYRGLQRFELDDSELYFGPRQLLVDVLDALEETSLLCLTGPPACGKSSLLRAGVIPNWRELEGEHSHAFIFSPGEDPFTELSHALLAAGCSEDLAAVAREPAHYVFRRIEEFLQPEDRWVILVDQFEEAGRATGGEQEARDAAFMSSLVELAGRPDSRIKVIVALRDDFFWKLGHFPDLARVADQHLYRLIELTEKELHHAITQPAKEHGVDIEPALLRHILKDLPDQRTALPLLQHVLDVLWIARGPDQKELRLDDYLVLGGLSGALRRRLETIYAGLSYAGKAALRQALLRLVDVSGMSLESRGPGLALPYRMALEDFTEIREREALEMLMAARLLMYQQGPRTIVELPVPVYLQAWPRFRRWVQEINEAVALRNQLAEDAGRWKFMVNRKGDAAGTKELWKGGHLEWALELRERGDFDSLVGGLSRDEDAFLDASRAAEPPKQAAPSAPVQTPRISPAVATSGEAAHPTLSQEELREASAELAGVLGEDKPVTAVKAIPLDPKPSAANDTRKLTGQFYISKEEAAEAGKTIGGPALKQKLQEEDLKPDVESMELQHELIVRERLIKQLKMILAGAAVAVLVLFVLAMKGCMDSAALNAKAWPPTAPSGQFAASSKNIELFAFPDPRPFRSVSYHE